MKKILFLKGLPASGKSTFAKELVSKEPDTWVRVNKDDLRFMLHDRKWSKGREKTVEAMQVALAQEALERGQSVIVDNTHLSQRHENIWRDIAKLHNAEFEVKEFDTSVEECLERDQKRAIPAGAVGKDVILQMFYQSQCQPYEHNPDLPNAIICDIDGTLAMMKDRGAYEWDKVKNDTVNEAVKLMLQLADNTLIQILLLSGRDGSCEVETREWLSENGIEYTQLWMREAGNTEKDTIIKRRLFDEHVAGKYNVLCVFDDRPCMVRMWRQMGLFCFDCGNGIEF